MDAPKRIGLVYNGLGGWRLWDVNEPGMGGVDRPHAEYLLAAEHDRLMAEKTAEIARLREALRRIDRDIGIGILHHDDGLWETAYYRLKEVARAALGGDNG